MATAFFSMAARSHDPLVCMEATPEAKRAKASSEWESDALGREGVPWR